MYIKCILKVLKCFDEETALGEPSITIKQGQKRTPAAINAAVNNYSHSY